MADNIIWAIFVMITFKKIAFRSTRVAVGQTGGRPCGGAELAPRFSMTSLLPFAVWGHRESTGSGVTSSLTLSTVPGLHFSAEPQQCFPP